MTMLEDDNATPLPVPDGDSRPDQPARPGRIIRFPVRRQTAATGDAGAPSDDPGPSAA